MVHFAAFLASHRTTHTYINVLPVKIYAHKSLLHTLTRLSVYISLPSKNLTNRFSQLQNLQTLSGYGYINVQIIIRSICVTKGVHSQYTLSTLNPKCKL